ncbi:HPr kinase/phosphorylase [Caulobacter sp. NIBR1757]|uniref:HPr kinase/phosphorylase n=1 Tax=Caulobacter sp. NIBR1757 TaxID=3016000 RepID=UPI0022F0F33D|nr:HPr kinase/phosphorylase [Caulobacter sp. NIBR1757]WGM37408.1 HPr kinase/phosphorylase [Caulobacter sp. NIBR1757]
MILHAGLVALRQRGRWRGVLIEGPSGAGKSDLALRTLNLGGRLVADDRVLAWTSEGRLFGRAPDTLSGLLEMRGLGIAPVEALPYAGIDLIVACEPDPAAIERLPEPETEERLGVTLPLRRLWPFEPAAPLKLIAALERVGFR